MQTDNFGIWLKLRKLKPQIRTESINKHSTEIIDILGGIDNILNCVLKSCHSLSFDRSKQLIHLFNTISSQEDENEDDGEEESELSDQNDDESIHFLDISDDSISHICSFLRLKELMSFEKTSTDMSAICHCPSSLYELDETEYEKLLFSIDEKVRCTIQAYLHYDENILSNILQKLTGEIDVHRFTRLRSIHIDTSLTADRYEITDNHNRIHPITQYFIFKNMINKLGSHCLHSLIISHFEVQQSAIYDYPNNWRNKRKILDLKDYFPKLRAKKLRIPCGLCDFDKIQDNQHFSFVFSQIYGVHELDFTSPRKLPNEIIDYVMHNKNEFNVKKLESSIRNDQIQHLRNSPNIMSLVHDISKINTRMFVLCQQSLHSLHLDFHKLCSTIKCIDLSNIKFVALKELCLREFGKNGFIFDQTIDYKENCFKTPNVEIVTLYNHAYVHRYEKEQEPLFGSILAVLGMFDITHMKMLNFNGSFSSDVPANYGNRTMLLWLQDISKCLNQEDVSFSRFNINLKYDPKALWDYKYYHLDEVTNILNNFDECNNCESILLRLACVCTAKVVLWSIRDSARELGWNVDIGECNWRYVYHAKMNGELHTFQKGPICHEFTRYPCWRCQ